MRVVFLALAFLALAFLAELAAWSALGVAAFVLAGGGWQGWVAAFTTVVIVITVWGLIASPKAKAPAAAVLATKIRVFGGAAAALVLIGHPGWAAALSGLISVSLGGVRFTTPGPPADRRVALHRPLLLGQRIPTRRTCNRGVYESYRRPDVSRDPLSMSQTFR